MPRFLANETLRERHSACTRFSRVKDHFESAWNNCVKDARFHRSCSKGSYLRRSACLMYCPGTVPMSGPSSDNGSKQHPVSRRLRDTRLWSARAYCRSNILSTDVPTDHVSLSPCT